MQNLKQRSKAGEDALNLMRHYMERREHTFTFDNPRFAERYIEGELNLLIHFLIGQSDEEFVAWLQREHPIGGRDLRKANERRALKFAEPLQKTSMAIAPEIHAVKSRTDRHDEPVFVDIVKLMEPPDGVVPTLIRFGSINHVYRILPHALYFSRRFASVSCGSVGDGKVHMPPRSGISSSKIKSVSQVVEGASKILEHVADDHAEYERRGIDALQVVDQLARLRIALESNNVWLGVQKGSDIRFQITDVLFGPIDFLSDRV
jgi:hypothetical protein